MKRDGLRCRVYYSLLVIAYFEAVLWTSCLFVCDAAVISGGLAAESHDYILRETVNLKLVERQGDGQGTELPAGREQELKRADLRWGSESVCALLRKERLEPVTPVVLQQAIVGLSNLPVLNARQQRGQRRNFASTSAATLQNVTVPDAPPLSKPASDVIAGATARAASQATIHPLDTLKVRMQAKPVAGGLRALAYEKLVLRGPKGAARAVRSLYRGVLGAASGAGIAIGAYFAFYGVATRLVSRHTNLNRTAVAFVSGAAAAAGSSVVKVPLAVCIRSVQAKVYPNPFIAAHSICRAAGPQGLFTGYLPTLLEDVPDMAFKFAAYESLRSLHKSIVGRKATHQEDFLCGAVAGAFAAAATTPLDVLKTTLMCTAAQKPSLLLTSKAIMRNGGVKAFFAGVGPRAASNGINSAVFFTIFECFRGIMATQAAAQKKSVVTGVGAGKADVDVHEVSYSEA